MLYWSIYSSIIFNILVSVLYIATKLGNMILMQACGTIVLSLIIPFTITMLGYMKEKAKKKDDHVSRSYSLLSLSGITISLHP
jgi:hypothetical protein